MKRFVDIPPNLTRMQLDCTFHSQKSQQSGITRGEWRPVFLHKNPSFQTTFNGQTPQNQLIQYWPNQVNLSKFSQVVKRLGLTTIKPSFFFFEHCSVCLFLGVPSNVLVVSFCASDSECQRPSTQHGAFWNGHIRRGARATGTLDGLCWPHSDATPPNKSLEMAVYL